MCLACADGEHLGTLADTVDEPADLQDGYAGRGYAAVGSFNDIYPRTGLDVGRLNSLFERPAAELVSIRGQDALPSRILRSSWCSALGGMQQQGSYPLLHLNS